MARQRLVKPEFFQHEELHRAELVSALPLRVAYIGLWCQADRRGLFAWKPGRLKLNILPFDTVDFSSVLDALESAGFVRSYVVDGQRFGCIPAFAKHQSFHVRELADKTIPEPPSHDVAREQHGAGPVRARAKHGASTPVTVTVTGTDTVTGTEPSPRAPRALPEWVPLAVAQYAEKVGPIPPGRMRKALSSLVTLHGWDSVAKGLADYLSATPLAKARPEWFAERGTYWVELAKQPMIDPETCEPTERQRVLIGRTGRAA